jgi:hypothetical protein
MDGTHLHWNIFCSGLDVGQVAIAAQVCRDLCAEARGKETGCARAAYTHTHALTHTHTHTHVSFSHLSKLELGKLLLQLLEGAI